MQNSSRASRFGFILFMMVLLAGGLYWASIYIRAWLHGDFQGEHIFYIIFAGCLAFIGGFFGYNYIHHFFEKPVIIRGMVLKKSIEIERTTDLETGEQSSTIKGYHIEVGTGIGQDKDQYNLRNEVYDWLDIGDVVDLTYFQSIDEVTRIHKIASSPSRGLIRRHRF